MEALQEYNGDIETGHDVIGRYMNLLTWLILGKLSKCKALPLGIYNMHNCVYSPKLIVSSVCDIEVDYHEDVNSPDSSFVTIDATLYIGIPEKISCMEEYVNYLKYSSDSISRYMASKTVIHIPYTPNNLLVYNLENLIESFFIFTINGATFRDITMDHNDTFDEGVLSSTKNVLTNDSFDMDAWHKVCDMLKEIKHKYDTSVK